MFLPFCKTTLKFLLQLWALTAISSHVLAASDKPNILFVISDDQSWLHTSAFGDKVVKTPAFDRIAKEGVMFTHSYVASPSCSPSRVAILSGQDMWRLKQGGLLHSSIAADTKMYTHLLEDAGYHVGMTGKGYAPGKWDYLGLKRRPTGKAYDENKEELMAHGITPLNYTADFISKAALAGKAIFCEKPLDLDKGPAIDALEIVRRTGVTLLLGFNRRFDPHFARLKAGIESGSIGTVEMVQITSRDPLPPPIEYVRVSGGLFKDMMIHDFDMARWLLGEEPLEVMATASALVDSAIGEVGDFDSALVTLKTASGKLCMISNSRRAVYGYDQRIEVHGSDGLIEVGNVRESQVSISGQSGRKADPVKQFFLERYAEAYRREIAHFADILNNNAQPIVNGDDGLRALALAEAAAEAFRTQSTVRLN